METKKCPKCGTIMKYTSVSCYCDGCGYVYGYDFFDNYGNYRYPDSLPKGINDINNPVYIPYKGSNNITFEDRVLEKLESIEDKLSKLLEKGDK